ncbi:hypothetical protein GCM10010106_35470 [Thermopolyspora flexuosa]|uniref:Uncharacterized protein n=1 Tax=Thermopolyspora flexuosa TaxID=103836 RepID=A0A543J197_9ACTN|nr:hypothetical protein [Thermopolyspora flexuosa]TQM76601.1 hypothetical protein FHX40_3346 [Thermopolyspora flexuosa]GGM85422.1 hypothetical protein GCM10010106_35470 [Thermopolyspora flexuosa]
MDDRPPRRRPPYATRVWPPPTQDPPSPDPQARPAAMEHAPPVAEGPAPEDALPPSARRYGTPTPPPPPRIPRPLARALVVLAVLVVGGGLVAGLVAFGLGRLRDSAEPPPRVVDALAGVSFALPPGWRAGRVAPVTAFTSVVNHENAIVMARPDEGVRASGVRQAAAELGEFYSRLLLHADKVTVVEDRGVTVGGRAAHVRSLRAEYRDVVNAPSYLRVMVIEGERSGTVVVGMAQPDEPRLRGEIAAVMTAMR